MSGKKYPICGGGLLYTIKDSKQMTEVDEQTIKDGQHLTKDDQHLIKDNQLLVFSC